MGEAKIKVLIVDDSAIARGIFEKAFNNTQKFQVVGMVSNGRKAVDFCKENEVHLVVTDYDMPEMNGIEETRILAKELGKPVCIYSEDNSIKTDALEAGAMLFQIKPSFSSFSSQGMVLFIKKIEDSIKNENIALSREQLLNKIWGYDFFGDDRTVDTHIKMLRANLGEYRDMITTVRGIGYKFVKE